MTAKYPELVSKLIIVGAGPFEEKYTARIRDTRLKRLDHGQRAFIRNVMENGAFQESDNPRKIGKIFSEADSFNFSEAKPEAICFKPEIFNRVWPEAAELRRSGKLLEAASKIKCPVIAVHGDYDPHPAEGVEVPLKRALLNFSFIKLSRCGHKPWLEKFAREKFYSLIREELLKA
jgi:pimeloyl-ACP methyl ester carboxylesterase